MAGTGAIGATSVITLITECSSVRKSSCFGNKMSLVRIQPLRHFPTLCTKEGQVIDETKSRIPIWLVWATTDNSLTTLVGVTLTNSRAVSYRGVVLMDPHVIAVKIEPSEANHLFNPQWDTAWQNAYGEPQLTKLVEQTRDVERQRTTQLERELEQTKEALKRAAKRISEMEESLHE